MALLDGILGWPTKPRVAAVGTAVVGRLARFIDRAGRVAASLVAVNENGDLDAPGHIRAAGVAVLRGVVEFDSTVRAFFGHADIPSDWHAVAQAANGSTFVSGYRVSVGADDAGDVPVVIDVAEGSALVKRTTSRFGGTPLACAVFEVVGDDSAGQPTGGFMPARLTTTQRNNIPSPQAGLLIYNTTAGRLEIYIGGVWLGLTTTP